MRSRWANCPGKTQRELISGRRNWVERPTLLPKLADRGDARCGQPIMIGNSGNAPPPRRIVDRYSSWLFHDRFIISTYIWGHTRPPCRPYVNSIFEQSESIVHFLYIGSINRSKRGELYYESLSVSTFISILAIFKRFLELYNNRNV